MFCTEETFCFVVSEEDQEPGNGAVPAEAALSPGVLSPTSSLASGMTSPLGGEATTRTLTSMEDVTSIGNVTSPTQKASSGVMSPGYTSGMTSPTYRHSTELSARKSDVTSPTQRHSAEITFGTCYGPPPTRKSPNVTSPTQQVTSPTQKSTPTVTSPFQKSSPEGVTSPTHRFQQKDVLSPTQAAVQVCVRAFLGLVLC